MERARVLQPTVNGMVNGQKFSQFRDSDDRLGPVIEAFVNNTYVWLPLESIKSMVLSAPSYLRDLMWIPAKLECQGGERGDAFLPVLYAGSELDDSEQVRLGRITEWVALGADLVGGVGQKTFVVDNSEKALLEIRDLTIDATDA
jgi:type VI secretion system protein ImpE